MKPNNHSSILLAAAATLAFGATTKGESFNIEGDAHSHRFANGEKTVVSFVQSGTFTVIGSGTVELLAVGGGGGGGAFGSSGDDAKRAAGGGAGGLVHMDSFAVSAGTYTISIGGGGPVGQNGKDTIVSGNGTTVTAYGGGHGAAASSGPGAAGGSGGGAAATGGGVYAAGGDGVSGQGHDGSWSTYNWGCGGGGGAGGISLWRTGNGHTYTNTVDYAPADYVAAFGDTQYYNRFPAWGGDGLAIDITGASVYYAGGGAAARLDGLSNNAQGGLGGGGGYTNGVGSAGTDGLGGGGAGGCAGGSGVVIVSFVASSRTTGDFTLSGGDSVSVTPHGVVHTFTQDGTLVVTGSGSVELLAVGGGGGGGLVPEGGTARAAGGGAGGLVHIASVPVTAGSYAIAVGAGGEIGENGGNTSALGAIAYGGGAGGDSTQGADPDQPGSDGGSGGGSTHGEANGGTPLYGGSAAYGVSAPPFSGNLGHDGSWATYAWGAGGGGGAGGMPLWRNRDGNLTYTNTVDYAPADYVAAFGDTQYYNRFPAWGGDGLAFDITGESVYYAGGGAGYRAGSSPLGGKGGGGASLAAGTDGLGGGGGANARGGSGVVIVRYLPDYKEAFAARGGSHAMDGEYRVHTFTSDGTFTMPCAGLVDILLVGGGGGGGAFGSSGDDAKRAAGGGAGGLVYLKNVVLAAGAHSVTVGAGGPVGENGRNTILSADLAGHSHNVVAYGGGHGAAASSGPGACGGSGGGAATTSGGVYTAGGDGVSGQGHDGSWSTYNWGCGGGGGAGGMSLWRTGNGHTYTNTVDYAPTDYVAAFGDTQYYNRFPAWGGDGLAIDITGASVYYAGGGAAARLDGLSNNAQGGLGGGGGYTGGVGSAGTDGLGGGGAGGCAGGSGVVIIRYKYAPSGTVITLR